jgi:hypothetical protein
MSSKIKKHEAEQQARDEHWQCATCSAPAQEHNKYCLSCELYWQDFPNDMRTSAQEEHRR